MAGREEQNYYMQIYSDRLSSIIWHVQSDMLNHTKSYATNRMLDYKPLPSHVMSREFAEVYDRFELCTRVSMYLYCSMLFGHASLYSCMYLYPAMFNSSFVSVLNTGSYKYYHRLSPIFTPPTKLLAHNLRDHLLPSHCMLEQGHGHSTRICIISSIC
jgi:hypothetical protein